MASPRWWRRSGYPEVLTQLSAASAGLEKIGFLLLRERVQHRVAEGIAAGEGEAFTDELIATIQRFARRATPWRQAVAPGTSGPFVRPRDVHWMSHSQRHALQQADGAPPSGHAVASAEIQGDQTDEYR